jgi:transposase
VKQSLRARELLRRARAGEQLVDQLVRQLGRLERIAIRADVDRRQSPLFELARQNGLPFRPARRPGSIPGGEHDSSQALPTQRIGQTPPGRHAFEAKTLLGERFAGIVCSDRWRGYDYLDPNQRQLCWAHLLRDFTSHSEGLSEQHSFGCAGLVIAHQLFAAWDAYQQDGSRARLQAQIAPLQTKLRTLLEHAARKSPRTKYHRDFARNLLKRWPALWTFTHSDGVEPTNNHAERGLRGAVIYRKLSLGSQSERGERTIERLLSASITCRLRQQSLFAYLSQALAAHARGDPVPALT